MKVSSGIACTSFSSKMAFEIQQKKNSQESANRDICRLPLHPIYPFPSTSPKIETVLSWVRTSKMQEYSSRELLLNIYFPSSYANLQTSDEPFFVLLFHPRIGEFSGFQVRDKFRPYSRASHLPQAFLFSTSISYHTKLAFHQRLCNTISTVLIEAPSAKS